MKSKPNEDLEQERLLENYNCRGRVMSRIIFLKNHIKNLTIIREGKERESDEYESLTKMIDDYGRELFELENPIKKANVTPEYYKKITIKLKTGELLTGHLSEVSGYFEENRFFAKRSIVWDQEYIESWFYC